MGDGLCADEAERRDVHDGGVHGQVHGQAVGQVRRAVDRLHGEEYPVLFIHCGDNGTWFDFSSSFF